MSKLIALLSGGAGIWWLLGGLLVATAAGATGGYVARGVIDAPALALANQHTAEAKTSTQACIASHEKGRADGAEQAIVAIGTAADAVRDAAAGIQTKANARAVADANFLKDVANAKPSQVCLGSAAERAYRASVQPSGQPAGAP